MRIFFKLIKILSRDNFFESAGNIVRLYVFVKRGGASRNDDYITVANKLMVFAIGFADNAFYAVTTAGFAKLSVDGDTKFCFHGRSVGVLFEIAKKINRNVSADFAFSFCVGTGKQMVFL